MNSGLMTFFFFVLGLEARREFDLGDFRERRRFVPPFLASVGGMGAAPAIYLHREQQGHVGANRIAQDVEGADLICVPGTPTLFINGRRHHGAYDIDTLSRAVRAAGARAKLPAS
jgi:hypothetical protein